MVAHLPEVLAPVELQTPSNTADIGLNSKPATNGRESTAELALFHAIFAQSPEAIVLTRVSDDALVAVNEEWLRLTGFSREEVIGRTAVQIGQWLDPADRERALIPLKNGGRVTDATVTMLMKDRQPRMVRLNATIVRQDADAYILFYLRDVTAENLAREALVAGEKALAVVNEKLNRQVKLYEMTESMAKVGHWVYYPEDQALQPSQGYLEMGGLSLAPGAPLRDHLRRVFEDDRGLLREAIARMDGRTVEFRSVQDDGSIAWVRTRMLRQMEHGVVKAEIGVIQEITAERQALQAVGDQLDFIQKLTSKAPGMVYQFQIWPDGRREFPFASAAIEQLFGVTAEEVRFNGIALFKKIVREDFPLVRDTTDASSNNLTPWQCEFRTEPQPGIVRWLYGNSTPQLLSDGSVLSTGSVVDITLRKQAEAEIEKLAFFDALTGLPNRRMLMDRLTKALSFSERRHSHGALFFIDLDNFKALNDTLGHQMGDELLKQVATRLLACVREVDTVARLGGDEFVVMLEDLGADSTDAARQATDIGQKILNSLNQNYLLAQGVHHSSPSIGVTLFHRQEVPMDELLKRADLAMYQAKAAGRNTLRFYDPLMQAAASDRARLEHDLRAALQEGQFSLYYQPVVNAQSRATGVEALLRWKHPVRGMVPPAEFIPVAEQNGMILELGHWVLVQACQQLLAWSLQPHTRHLTMAVNVSARQFRHPDFSTRILTVLRETGANPYRLKLELTESLLLTDLEDVTQKMSELRSIGVSFALDDFGTGYSSLSYLKRLPLDQLKIDKSFVRDVLTDPNDAAIARTILSLAESLDLGVVAEGVETAGQRDFLLSNGCKAFQGYFFGHPVPVEALDLPAI